MAPALYRKYSFSIFILRQSSSLCAHKIIRHVERTPLRREEKTYSPLFRGYICAVFRIENLSLKHYISSLLFNGTVRAWHVHFPIQGIFLYKLRVRMLSKSQLSVNYILELDLVRSVDPDPYWETVLYVLSLVGWIRVLNPDPGWLN